jgi:hypothetical protein
MEEGQLTRRALDSMMQRRKAYTTRTRRRVSVRTRRKARGLPDNAQAVVDVSSNGTEVATRRNVGHPFLET